MTPIARTVPALFTALLCMTSTTAVAKSKCFPREGKCVAVTVNGQAAVKMTKKDRRQLEAYEGMTYVSDVETWIPEPIRGELRVAADTIPGEDAAAWFGRGAQAQAQIVPLSDVALDVDRSLGTAPSVRIGGEAVVTERLELQDDRLPSGPYLLRVTVRGADNWDRATIFFRVAAD